MYFTDRGIEELQSRRGEEEVTLDWLGERMQDLVNLHPDFQVPLERAAPYHAHLRTAAA